MRRYILISILVLSFVLQLVPLSNLATASQKPEILIGSDYFPAVHKALSQVQQSIDIVMYFMIMDPENSTNPVNILINDLIEARKKDARVKVILENERFKESQLAFETLRRNGIDVYYDTPKTYLHSKAIVIDSRICIFGSTNWSKTAFYNNHEISIILDSKETAQAIRESLSDIIIQKIPPVPTEKEGLFLPEEFLLSPRAGRRLVKDRADKAFDLYLLFLRERETTKNDTLKLDYERYASLLGYKAPPHTNGREYYYEKLRRPLKRLQRRYGLLKYDIRKKEIILLKSPTQDYFALPFKYWEYNLPERVSLRAKYLYLISLLEAEKSVKNPYWFRSQKDLSTIYGLSDYTISLGLLELEREDIIEVLRGERTEEEFGQRQANIYQVNTLISPEEFQRRIDSLREKYGAEITLQAQSLSAQLNEPKDLTKIEIYIHLIKDYGYQAVKEANEKASRYKKGSALRDITTTIKLLQK